LRSGGHPGVGRLRSPERQWLQAPRPLELLWEGKRSDLGSGRWYAEPEVRLDHPNATLLRWTFCDLSRKAGGALPVCGYEPDGLLQALRQPARAGSGAGQPRQGVATRLWCESTRHLPGHGSEGLRRERRSECERGEGTDSCRVTTTSYCGLAGVMLLPGTG